MNRRAALKGVGAGVIAAGLAKLKADADDESARPAAGSQALRQSVCRWCFRQVPMDELCAGAKEIGLASVELVDPKDFAALQKHGLNCAMVFNPVVKRGDLVIGGIQNAWNRPEFHDLLVEAYTQRLKETRDAGYSQVICFSGLRRGLDDEQGVENCVTGLKRLMPIAEKLGVTLCMELLNSRINHPDYQCDRTEWGVEVSRRVGSERFKLLYDIYHMQVMEGNVIATIQRYHEFIAHYHTAGVPGRNDLDENQELFYPAIARAIAATGFRGFIGHEFAPKADDWKGALRRAATTCGVSVLDPKRTLRGLGQ